MNVRKSIIVITSIAMLFASTLGCAENKGEPESDAWKKKEPTTITFRKDMKVVIELRRDGSVQVYGPKGEKMPRCRLPGINKDTKTRQDKKNDLPICENSQNTSITDLKSISVVSHTGSGCDTTNADGDVYGSCTDWCKTWGICP